jgi:hypothetical protein
MIDDPAVAAVLFGAAPWDGQSPDWHQDNRAINANKGAHLDVQSSFLDHQSSILSVLALGLF